MPVVTHLKRGDGGRTGRIKRPLRISTFRKLRQLLATETSARHTS